MRSSHLTEVCFAPSGGSILLAYTVTATAFISLSLKSSSDCSEFVDRLTLPGLAELETGDDSNENLRTPWPGDALNRLFKRSSCNVTELTLSGISTPPGALLPFLRGLPQLQLFDAEEHTGPQFLLTADIIHALSLREHGQFAILPKLLSFGYADVPHITATQLANLVESRGWGEEPQKAEPKGNRLVQVKFFYSVPHGSAIDEVGRARLRACRDAGLDIRCGWYGGASGTL